MQQSLIKVIKRNTGRGSSHMWFVLKTEGTFQSGMTQSVYTNINGSSMEHHTSTGFPNVFVDGKKPEK